MNLIQNEKQLTIQKLIEAMLTQNLDNNNINFVTLGGTLFNIDNPNI